MIAPCLDAILFGAVGLGIVAGAAVLLAHLIGEGEA